MHSLIALNYSNLRYVFVWLIFEILYFSSFAALIHYLIFRKLVETFFYPQVTNPSFPQKLKFPSSSCNNCQGVSKLLFSQKGVVILAVPVEWIKTKIIESLHFFVNVYLSKIPEMFGFAGRN